MKGFWGLVHQSGSVFGISFPDVPGCISAADSLEEVLAEGMEALSAHLALLKIEGDPLPRPRSYAELTADPEQEWGSDDASWHYVQPREVAAAKMRINIMVGAELLRRADDAAEAAGTTRSALIEEALRERLVLASERIDRTRASRARARPVPAARRA